MIQNTWVISENGMNISNTPDSRRIRHESLRLECVIDNCLTVAHNFNTWSRGATPAQPSGSSDSPESRLLALGMLCNAPNLSGTLPLQFNIRHEHCMYFVMTRT